MCEILVLKQNEKKLEFTKSAIEEALEANNNGAGYVILEKNEKKGTFELNEVKHLDLSVAATVVKTDSKAVKRSKEKKALDDMFWVDFELDNVKKYVTLTSLEGVERKMKLPYDLYELSSLPYAEQVNALTDWMDTKGLFADFSPTQDAETKTELAKILKEEEEEVNDYNAGFGQEYTYKGKEPSYYEKKCNAEAAAVDELYKKQQELQKNQLMIMHFRTSTSGHGTENTQPIMKGNFMVIHNGVFTGAGNINASDTAMITEKLDKLYEVANIKTNKEEETFITRFLEITEGWYSTFIYSLKTKKLYYYRKGASFYSAHGGLMLSTKESRFPTAVREVNSFVV
jgi:hypothetical protein